MFQIKNNIFLYNQTAMYATYLLETSRYIDSIGSDMPVNPAVVSTLLWWSDPTGRISWSQELLQSHWDAFSSLLPDAREHTHPSKELSETEKQSAFYLKLSIWAK